MHVIKKMTGKYNLYSVNWKKLNKFLRKKGFLCSRNKKRSFNAFAGKIHEVDGLFNA